MPEIRRSQTEVSTEQPAVDVRVPSQLHCVECGRRYAADAGLETCPVCKLMLTAIIADTHIGSLIDGKFQVMELIGKGAVGRVYRAEDVQLHIQVALKVLKMTQGISEDQRLRFQNEARSVNSLIHPNIVRVFDYGLSPEPYLVMEFVDGKTLAQVLLEQGPIPAKRALPMFIELCSGLELAHNAGLIHRDIKPSNVMIDAKSGTPKILDFGLVKGFVDDVKVTKTGQTIGSPAYMSPEQCRGDRLDLRSDIYNFGCLMFEVFTGKLPFSGGNTVELMFKHLESELPHLTSVHPRGQYPPGLQSILERATAKLPDDRYANMGQLKADLELVLTGKGKRIAATGNHLGSKLKQVSGIALLICLITVSTLAFMFFQYWHSLPDYVPAAQPLAGSTIANGMQAYLDANCLKPDVRFLTALEDVAKFTNQPDKKAQAILAPDGWHIRLDQRDIGLVSRQANHAELSALLDRFARDSIAEAGLQTGPVAKPDAATPTVSALISHLLALNMEYDKEGMTGALAAAAARDLTWLSVVCNDRLGGLDQLQARALALSSIARQLHQNMAATEALLDWNTGYTAAATQAAKKLPENDPVRAYLLNDSAKLAQLASASETGSAHYLMMLRRSQSGEESDLLGGLPGKVWNRSTDRDLALAKLDALAKKDFRHSMLANEMLLCSINTAVAGMAKSGTDAGACSYDSDMRHWLDGVKSDATANGDKADQAAWQFIRQKQPAKQFEAFDRTMLLALQKVHGKIFTPSLLRHYYETLFCSALVDISGSIEHQYGAGDAFQKFVNSVGAPPAPESPLLRALRTALDQHKDATIESCNETLALAHPAAPFFQFRAYSVLNSLEGADSQIYTGFRLLLAGLDNRPQNLQELAESLHPFNIPDQWQQEAFYQQYADSSQSGSALVWLDWKNGNVDHLKNIAGSVEEATDTRLRAVSYLQDLNAAEPRSIEELLRNIAAQSASVEATIAYATLLEEQLQPDQAAAAIHSWQQQHPQAPDWASARAQSALSRLALESKKNDQALALALARSAAACGSHAALLNLGDIERDTGDLDAAMHTYTKAYERYGDTVSFARRLGVAWRMDNPDLAADMLMTRLTDSYGRDGWHHLIAPELLEAYKDQPDKVNDAFDIALEKLQPPLHGSGHGGPYMWNWFEFLPMTYMDQHQWGRAFHAWRDSVSGFPAQTARFKILAYQCLVNERLGNAAARKYATSWFEKMLSKHPRIAAAPVLYAVPAFDYHQYELLWSCIALHPQGNAHDVATIWNLRAAAELAQPGLAGEHKRDLEKEVAARADCVAGKYYLGMIDDEQLDKTNVSNNPLLARELSMARAFKSRIRGDFVSAAKWYALALAMGPQNINHDPRNYEMDPCIQFSQRCYHCDKSLARMTNADFDRSSPSLD